jgi:hypothetical protein
MAKCAYLYPATRGGHFITDLLSPIMFIVVVLASTTFVTRAQEAGEVKPARTSVEELVKLQRSWGSKMNSTGATLSLKEVSRRTSGGNAVVRYRMMALGLPVDKVYSLVMWQLGGQPENILEGVTIDETGSAICTGKPGTCGGNKPNDPVELAMSGALGEPKRVGLVAADKGAYAFGSVVPFPNRGTDAGCTLEATLVTPNAEAVILSGSGFKPGIRLNVEISSEGEKQHLASNASENGSYEGAVLPFKKGVTKGRTQVSVLTETCKPEVSFAWGTGSYALQR